MTISTNIFKPIIMAAMGVLSIPMMHAIVAKPGIIQASQPDGTVVSIRLEGQFGNHRAYSSDGYLLTTDSEGFYVFADCTDDGEPIATNIRAINPELRTADITASISRLDQSRITDAFLNRAELSTRSGDSPMKGPGLYSDYFPSTGEQTALAILVNFSDNSFAMDDPKDFFYRQLNEEGFSDYGGTGSARDYFIENSGGKFMPTFDVYGPVSLKRQTQYYGSNDKWGNDEFAHEMVVEACQLLDDEIDFSKYDRNGDGVIDNVYVFYAGFGEADGGPSTTIWPHSYDLVKADPSKKYTFDGVQLNHYACSNEVDYATKVAVGIGSFTHEFSHVLGLPDLYTTNGSNAFTPGYWSILDVGSYNNNSCTPPNYSSFERYALDWMEPEIIDTPGQYTLEPLPDSNKAYMFTTDKTREYFLFENRQQEGNDEYLPGHGMLVWHIHFNQLIWDDNIVNNTASHQYVDLVEADDIQSNRTLTGDPFPGKSNVTSYTADTSPAFLSWSGASPGYDIVNIAESNDGIITFTANAHGAGIDDIFTDDGMGVTIDGREISCDNGTATVYDLSGKTVATVNSNTVTLLPGLYIVSYANKTQKIAIK